MTNMASPEALLHRGLSFAAVLAYAADRAEREWTAVDAAPESRCETIAVPAWGSADVNACDTVRPTR